jgi:hypothetical protein
VIWDRGLTAQVPTADRKEQDGLPVALTIGDTKTWLEQGKVIAAEHRVIYLDFNEVTPEMVLAIGPAVVMSPMLSNSFDCIDLACILQDAGFKGKYRALSRAIPNPKLVRREINDICPGLYFDLIVVDGIEVPSTYA